MDRFTLMRIKIVKYFFFLHFWGFKIFRMETDFDFACIVVELSTVWRSDA